MEKVPLVIENVTGQTLSSLSDEINNVVRKFSQKGYTLRGIPHVSVNLETNGFYTTLVFDECDEVKSERIEILTSQGIKRLGHEANAIIKEFAKKGYTLRGIPHVAPDSNTGAYYTLLVFEKI